MKCRKELFFLVLSRKERRSCRMLYCGELYTCNTTVCHRYLWIYQGCIKPPAGWGVKNDFWGVMDRKNFGVPKCADFFDSFVNLYPLLTPNVVSHCCHQMLYPTAPPPNVVTWIKKMIFERGGGDKKLIWWFYTPLPLNISDLI